MKLYKREHVASIGKNTKNIMAIGFESLIIAWWTLITWSGSKHAFSWLQNNYIHNHKTDTGVNGRWSYLLLYAIASRTFLYPCNVTDSDMWGELISTIQNIYERFADLNSFKQLLYRILLHTLLMCLCWFHKYHQMTLFIEIGFCFIS